DIRNMLEISDTTKKSQMLKEKFNYYGECVVISTIVGGVITIENWSEIDDVSRSRLKAYLQWSIDCAKGMRLKTFEDASIDDLNLQIKKFKSTYQLLPEDLVRQIPEYFDIKHIDKFYPIQATKQFITIWYNLATLKPERAKKAAVKFFKEPKIIHINKITIILTQPETNNFYFRWSSVKKEISTNHPIDFPTQQSDIKFNDPDAHQKIEQLLETE
ncbi:7513_t:CDS:2, partial [Gigaspora rosea]